MSELPRRSTRLGGGTNTVENEDPSDESTEALAQRAAEEPRPAQLVSEQGIPANLYPDPGLPLTGPLTAMTKEVVEQSKAEPAAPRRLAVSAGSDGDSWTLGFPVGPALVAVGASLCRRVVIAESMYGVLREREREGRAVLCYGRSFGKGAR